MGRGKTTAMMNYINNDTSGDHYLFITPYLTEVSRIVNGCKEKGFMAPSEDSKKRIDIKYMLKNKKNIVSTHALFGMLDDEDLSYIQDNGYVLIMDEVACVLDQFYATKSDIDIMRDQCVEISDGGRITWTNDNYSGEFSGYRDKILSWPTYSYNDDNWIVLMPPTFFTSFKDVYIMTYMFEHQIQRCYFDLNDVPYTRKYVNGRDIDSYTISDSFEKGKTTDYAGLIDILQNDRMNEIGNGRTDLSKSWYVRNAYNGSMEIMKKNLFNFFHNYSKTPSNKNIWTVYCEEENNKINWRSMLTGKGYAKGFLACNARGTNDYRDRTAAAYIINRFPNSAQKNFLNRAGISLDSDMFALSEMLQWIWRSAIRDGSEIKVYIPSSRMRTLLENWIAQVSE
jgi:hypothetical protein